MKSTVSRVVASALAITTIAYAGACADGAALTATRQLAPLKGLGTMPSLTIETADAVAQMQRVTARYHDLSVALAEGFIFLHGCETRPEEGPVGAVYVHFGRLLDGVIDPALPDALIYEPRKGGARLVGLEFAMPYALWTQQDPPELLGNAFQREDEFGVFGLHAWVWLHNPEGMFAESNPRVTCDA